MRSRLKTPLKALKMFHIDMFRAKWNKHAAAPAQSF